jgi:vacuolar-type H+-ATPase subunit F/Vma7
MGLLVVLGEKARVDGFALGGATVIPAESPDAVRRAWTSLPDDVTVVVLTHQAAGALGNDMTQRADVLSVVMPP